MAKKYDKWLEFQRFLPPDWTYLLSKDRCASAGYKKFNACSSFANMMDNIHDQDSGYEVIANKETRVWLYVDADLPGAALPNTVILPAVRKAVESRMIQEGIPVTTPLVSTASTKDKTSIHLKYKVLFMNLWALTAFMGRVIKDIWSAGTPELLYTDHKGKHCVVDATVYSNFRSYRCLGMTKLGKDAPLIAVDPETAMIPRDERAVDHLVKFYDEAGQVPDHIVPALVMDLPESMKRTRAYKSVMTKAPADASADDSECFALCQKYTDYLNRYDALVSVLQDKVDIGRVSIKASGIYVCSIKKNPLHVCPYAGRTHDSNNLFVVHNEHKRKLTLRCHDECCFHRKDVSFVIWDTTACDTDAWDKVDFSSMHAQAENIQWTETYEEPMMRDYPLCPIVCVRAGMGVGKTQALLRLASTFTKKTKALIVTYSQALAAKLSTEFGNHGFVNYKNTEGQIVDAKIVVCLDSMHRVATSQFDYVFLDEAVSLFLHFNSPLMGAKTSINLSMLELAIIQGSYVYFLDACMDHTFGKNVVDFFAGHKKCEPHWIHNTYVRKSNRHMIVDVVPMKGANAVTKSSQISRATSKVLELIRSGKNVVVCSSSKSFTVRLQNFILESRPETSMLVYNSDTNERLDDVGTLWKTCQLLVYSPTITAGVSFEDEHFDCLVAFVGNSRHAPTVDMTLQQLFRVRNLTEGAMHLYIHESNEAKDEVSFPQTMDGITKFLQSDIALTSKYFSMYKVNIPGVYRPSANHTLEYDTKRLSFVVIQGVVMMRNRSTMNYSKIMVDTLGNDYAIELQSVEVDKNKLTQVELDLLMEAPKKIEPVAWELLVPGVSMAMLHDVDEDTLDLAIGEEEDSEVRLASNDDRRVAAALRNLRRFQLFRWKTRVLTLAELEEFHKHVQVEDQALETYHRAMRFVQFCDRSLQENKASFVNCVSSDLATKDPNLEFFKGRRTAYSMKVMFGHMYLNHLTDDAQQQSLKAFEKVSVDESKCLDAYTKLIDNFSDAEAAKFKKMFPFKSTATGCMVAKKILGDCFGLNVVRRDPKSDRKYYHTILICEESLMTMTDMFGADVRRPLPSS